MISEERLPLGRHSGERPFSIAARDGQRIRASTDKDLAIAWAKHELGWVWGTLSGSERYMFASVALATVRRTLDSRITQD